MYGLSDGDSYETSTYPGSCSIKLSNYVGRIPLKTASSFSGFNADQL